MISFIRDTTVRIIYCVSLSCSNKCVVTVTFLVSLSLEKVISMNDVLVK